MEVLFKILLPILITIESGGNDKAVGDNGRAVGCLQIHEIMVDDVNRILGAKVFDYNDRWDREASKEIARIYFRHYSKSALKLKRSQALIMMGRQWNGGPNGHHKVATEAYGRKVLTLLVKLSPISLFLPIDFSSDF